MTTSVRILTTSTLDSSPSIVLTSSDGSKTLINCGEGCQRSFLESSNNTGTGGLRVRTVTRVCLTHIAHDAVGGLPGMILTAADATDVAISNVVAKNKAVENVLTSSNSSKKGLSDKQKDFRPVVDNIIDNQNIPSLDIVGPKGTKQFLHSLRHFMRRDKFHLNVNEGSYKQDTKAAIRGKAGKRAKKNSSTSSGAETFYVQTIPVMHHLYPLDAAEVGGDTAKRDEEGNSPEQKKPRMEDKRNLQGTPTEVLSFVFTSSPLQGKFLLEKARELGIPPGPLYAQLKAGKSVTFVDPASGKERTIESHEVVTKGSPGVAIGIIYCPSLDVLRQLKQSTILQKLYEGADDKPILDVMIHMAPRDVLDSFEYKEWMQHFCKPTDHILLDSSDCLTRSGILKDKDEGVSPFHSATLGAITRSLLHKEIFPAPIRAPESTDKSHHDKGETTTSSNVNENAGISDSELFIIRGRPMMEYLLIPRARKGLVSNTIQSDVPHGIRKDEWQEVHESAKASGAMDLANEIVCEGGHSNGKQLGYGELIFTGTGSAIPCKDRNVSGIYLRMQNGKAMLLDIGESTTGQLLRAKQRDSTNEDSHQLLRDIKAVWISHPHADHHLGILRFLTERNAVCRTASDPIVLMAPPNMFQFLTEYADVDPRIRGSYVPLDCRDMVLPKNNPFGDKLYNDLGITYCVAVPVAHCLYSFAVVIDGTAFGRLAYSGDCRPSNRFADVGIDTDLLIHEATFEDGMEDEAYVKRHCTVGEALAVGRRMRAKSIILTHFSQRYPRIPPLKQKINEGITNAMDDVQETSDISELVDAVPVVFAFDFMKLTPTNVATASKLTPALRLLYPGNEVDEHDCVEQHEGSSKPSPSASEILSVPGVFAIKEIL